METPILCGGLEWVNSKLMRSSKARLMILKEDGVLLNQSEALKTFLGEKYVGL